jgi:hypothetical protein
VLEKVVLLADWLEADRTQHVSQCGLTTCVGCPAHSFSLM